MEDSFAIYLKSDTFRLFMDKTLRDFACNTVENLCSNYTNEDFITSSQLHSIPTIIQQPEGFRALKELIHRQTEKNLKEKKLRRKKEDILKKEQSAKEGGESLNQETDPDKNKELFWSFLSIHISSTLEKKDSFRTIIKNELSSFLKDEAEAGEDKSLRNKIKKTNKERVNQAISEALSIYCEHFTSHYAYCAARRR
ncbi:hypothetical protein [Desulfobacter sp.]|uniref:hypothetical protein n=1 Tax=Desulfobacter sp. TaxID=2294 RepID=UPI002579CEFA|nr:hypothetical protein [Desulfobacter sp.]